MRAGWRLVREVRREERRPVVLYDHSVILRHVDSRWELIVSWRRQKHFLKFVWLCLWRFPKNLTEFHFSLCSKHVHHSLLWMTNKPCFYINVNWMWSKCLKCCRKAKKKKRLLFISIVSKRWIFRMMNKEITDIHYGSLHNCCFLCTMTTTAVT